MKLITAIVKPFTLDDVRSSLEQLGVRHRYEEFPDNHSSVDYRMDESLPFLGLALTGN